MSMFSIFCKDFAWWIENRLNVKPMGEAAKWVVGRKDHIDRWKTVQ